MAVSHAATSGQSQQGRPEIVQRGGGKSWRERQTTTVFRLTPRRLAMSSLPTGSQSSQATSALWHRKSWVDKCECWTYGMCMRTNHPATAITVAAITILLLFVLPLVLNAAHGLHHAAGALS